MQKINSRIFFLSAITAIVLVVFSYCQALNGPFILDDSESVQVANLNSLSFTELWRVATGNTSICNQ